MHNQNQGGPYYLLIATQYFFVTSKNLILKLLSIGIIIFTVVGNQNDTLLIFSNNTFYSLNIQYIYTMSVEHTHPPLSPTNSSLILPPF